MKKNLTILFLIIIINITVQAQKIIVGAERTEMYINKIMSSNYKIALVCNQTSTIGNTHIIDSLLSRGVEIAKIFTPEHGFRGNKDAGEKVMSYIDSITGIEVISLYGKNTKPTSSQMFGLDYIIFDIQDVGVRFYTYISTLQYILEAANESGTTVIVLDRPNPNGHYIDGPILEPRFKSFVGMQPIPIVYGMTIGEYAKMLVNERWLNNGVKPNLIVVPCLNYNHKMIYKLPIAPSPNLRTENAIALYPSLCLFEGTNVSVGRGTEKPFEIFGSPYLKADSFDYKFVPKPSFGAKNPLFKNDTCIGKDLTSVMAENKINLSYIIKAYKSYYSPLFKFFSNEEFFDKLAGNNKLRWQISNNKSEEEIRESWKFNLIEFNNIRKKHLLYEDFKNNF